MTQGNNVVTKEFQGMRLSALGMGTMRLPVFDGDDSKIDEEKTARMVSYAMEHGINYYDTAWGYHDGNSELVMGRVLSRYPRDRFYLRQNFRGMTSPIWIRWRRFLQNSWKNAAWIILISI